MYKILIGDNYHNRKNVIKFIEHKDEIFSIIKTEYPTLTILNLTKNKSTIWKIHDGDYSLVMKSRDKKYIILSEWICASSSDIVYILELEKFLDFCQHISEHLSVDEENDYMCLSIKTKDDFHILYDILNYIL